MSRRIPHPMNPIAVGAVGLVALSVAYSIVSAVRAIVTSHVRIFLAAGAACAVVAGGNRLGLVDASDVGDAVRWVASAAFGIGGGGAGGGGANPSPSASPGPTSGDAARAAADALATAYRAAVGALQSSPSHPPP